MSGWSSVDDHFGASLMVRRAKICLRTYSESNLLNIRVSVSTMYVSVCVFVRVFSCSVCLVVFINAYVAYVLKVSVSLNVCMFPICGFLKPNSRCFAGPLMSSLDATTLECVLTFHVYSMDVVIN